MFLADRKEEKDKYMRILRLLALSLLVPFFGCIDNDLPYPLILGQVQSMTIEGATQIKIDASSQIVSVVLSDTVDLRQVTITEMTITDDSRSTLNAGEVINLCSDERYGVGDPYSFTISTFQEYEWSIVAEQPITQAVVLSGSIGSAQFDNDNYKVVVNVAQTEDLYSIKVEEFSLAPSVAVYTPDPYQISDFSRSVAVEASYFGVVENWTITVQQISENVVTGSNSPWAKFAYLYADVLASSTLSCGFEYRRAADSEWTVLEAENVSGKVSAVAKDLLVNTQYVYRAYLGSEYGDEVSFTTDIAPVVPNMNFDEAYLDGTVWYFNESGGNSYWATGNEGVKAAGKASSTTSVEGDEAVSGKAVKMITYNDVLLVKVAAGNLFTGTYSTVLSSDPSEALKSAVMGRSFTGRPTSLSGWYRYSPEVLTSSSYWQTAATEFGYNFADSVGMNDWCQIYVVLEKWPDTATERPDDNLITRVGYAQLSTNAEVANYTEFTIPIEYYDKTTIPTHISLVATSSINGGYFCGAAGSTLYVDEFSFGYDWESILED